MEDVRAGDGVADATEDQARHDARVETAYAVDDAAGAVDRLDDLGIRARSYLLAVRVDVPYPLDPGRKSLLRALGEADVLPSQRW